MHLTASPEDYLSAGEQDYLSTLPPAIKDVPMVVLVNGGSRSDADLKVREADLIEHLINDRNQDQALVAAVPIGNTFNFTPEARPQGVDAKDLKSEPGEVVAKSDYELAQAIAFLKSRGAVRASAN